jgi:formylmethanofuran dehydrogenase subunit C
MSDTVTLSLRARVDAGLEVDGVTADRIAGLAEREIAALPVRIGARKAELGEFFSVRGERSERVRVEGALAQVHGLAAGTTGGEMVIDGDAGHLVAAKMTGGSVEVRGSVADEAGAAMAGGTLRVAGNAGDRLGAAVQGATDGMTGGEIVIGGSAGADAAARARRGLVVVGRNTGRDAARAMVAGTLIVLGRTGAEPGRASKRGTIIAVGGSTCRSRIGMRARFSRRTCASHLHICAGVTGWPSTTVWQEASTVGTVATPAIMTGAKFWSGWRAECQRIPSENVTHSRVSRRSVDRSGGFAH